MNANELADLLDDGWDVHMKDAATMLRQQQAEIEELKYEKSSGVYDPEPVAWMSPDGKFSTTEGKLFYIPLYTHLEKTLTDEEIGQIWKECMESPYMQVSNPVGFARAILRKAQEK